MVGIGLPLPFDLHKFVAANLSHRAMSQDEEVYSNPWRFDPGHHFTADGNLKDEPTYNHLVLVSEGSHCLLYFYFGKYS